MKTRNFKNRNCKNVSTGFYCLKDSRKCSIQSNISRNQTRKKKVSLFDSYAKAEIKCHTSNKREASNKQTHNDITESHSKVEKLRNEVAILKKEIKELSQQKESCVCRNDDYKEVSWECMAENVWVPYDYSLKTKFETAFVEDEEKIEFKIKNVSYSLSFSDMKETRQDSNKAVRKVRRVVHNNYDLSCLHTRSWSLSHDHWILQDDMKGVRVKEIDRNNLNGKLTREIYEFNIATGHYYNLIKNNKNNNSNHFNPKNVSKVWVIEYFPHHPVYKNFEKTRRKFQSESKARSEEWVFHGTANDVVLNIIKEGFKIGGKGDIPVRHGSSYGSGIYTAGGPTTPLNLLRQFSLSEDEPLFLAKGLRGAHVMYTDYNNSGPELWYDSWGSNDTVVFRETGQLLPQYVLFLEPLNKHNSLK